MNAGTDENKNQRRDSRIGNADLRLQLFCVFGIALIDTLEKLLAMLHIFRVRINLIHQPVFLPVFPCRPIRDFLNEPHDTLKVGGGFLHKIILHLRHAVGRGLNDQIIQILKIAIQIRLRKPAGICQCLDPRAVQPILGVACEAFFHNLLFLFVMLLFCRFHMYPSFCN